MNTKDLIAIKGFLELLGEEARPSGVRNEIAALMTKLSCEIHKVNPQHYGIQQVTPMPNGKTLAVWVSYNGKLLSWPTMAQAKLEADRMLKTRGESLVDFRARKFVYL